MNGLVVLLRLNLFFCLLLMAFSAAAANKYVRAGAGGTGTGADWTNAYTSLPNPLTRGDTYYIADGSYSGSTPATRLRSRSRNAPPAITVRRRVTVRLIATGRRFLAVYNSLVRTMSSMVRFATKVIGRTIRLMALERLACGRRGLMAVISVTLAPQTISPLSTCTQVQPPRPTRQESTERLSILPALVAGPWRARIGPCIGLSFKTWSWAFNVPVAKD